MSTPDASLLAVPVAAVAESWLEEDFLPQVTAAVHTGLRDGGVILLCADSDHEAEYLLRRATDAACEASLPVQEVNIRRSDPLLTWRDLWGTPDARGLLHGLVEGTVIVVVGGEYLPVSSVQERLHALLQHCRACRSVIILPVLRAAGLGPLISAGHTHAIEAPSFSAVDAGVRLDLGVALAASRIPGLSDGERLELVRRLLSYRPKSRAQLEHWITHCASIHDPLSELVACGPPASSGPTHSPVEVPRREELSAILDEIRRVLRDTSQEWESLRGEPLIFQHQRLLGPFDSPAPCFWFVALVSYASCIVLDAGRDAVPTIERFTYDADDGDIKGDAGSGFTALLSRLRTTMQHGLRTASGQDARTLAAVAAWYRQQCGTTSPEVWHARRLTAAFLEAFRTFVHGLHDVVNHLQHAPSRRVLFEELERNAGSIPYGDFVGIVRDAATAMGAALDERKFVARYRDRILSRLAGSPLPYRQRLLWVKEEVWRAATQELMRCPVDGNWLLDRGVAPGPELGSLLASFHAKWDSGSMEGEEFIAWCEAMVVQRSTGQGELG